MIMLLVSVVLGDDVLGLKVLNCILECLAFDHTDLEHIDFNYSGRSV